MAREVMKVFTLQLPAGRATPAPPVGTALGPLGLNSGEFCVAYNDATKDKMGDIIPVEITVYDDRKYDLRYLTPPTSFLLKKFTGIKAGSAKGSTETVTTISKEKIKEIAEIKLPDLNAYSIDDAIKIVSGTAKNMGIKVEE